MNEKPDAQRYLYGEFLRNHFFDWDKSSRQLASGLWPVPKDDDSLHFDYKSYVMAAHYLRCFTRADGADLVFGEHGLPGGREHIEMRSLVGKSFVFVEQRLSIQLLLPPSRAVYSLCILVDWKDLFPREKISSKVEGMFGGEYLLQLQAGTLTGICIFQKHLHVLITIWEASWDSTISQLDSFLPVKVSPFI